MQLVLLQLLMRCVHFDKMFHFYGIAIHNFMCLEFATNSILLQVWFALGFPCFIDVVFNFFGFYKCSSYVKHFIFTF